MNIGLPPEEPAAGPWRVERITDVIAGFTDRTRLAAERPLILAVDGRSSERKNHTRVARR